MTHEINSAEMENDTANLMEMSKDHLVKMIEFLRNRNKELEDAQKTFTERTDRRLEMLERVQNSNIQYLRRDSVEISGIPDSIPDSKLEDEVIKIFDIAGVKVGDQKLDKIHIHACHRIGTKGKTIVKTVNRKFAENALYRSKNLKGKSPYENSIYINSSFCKEYGFLNYIVRKAKRDGRIFRYKVRKGITSIQMDETDEFHEITHKIDLVKHNIVYE